MKRLICPTLPLILSYLGQVAAPQFPDFQHVSPTSNYLSLLQREYHLVVQSGKCLERKIRSGEMAQRKEKWVIKNQKTLMDMKR